MSPASVSSCTNLILRNVKRMCPSNVRKGAWLFMKVAKQEYESPPGICLVSPPTSQRPICVIRLSPSPVSSCATNQPYIDPSPPGVKNLSELEHGTVPSFLGLHLSLLFFVCTALVSPTYCTTMWGGVHSISQFPLYPHFLHRHSIRLSNT